MESLFTFLPIGYAFAAGVVTMFSPCSVAMLPSYISLQLGGSDAGSGGRLRRGLKAAGLALVASSGILLFWGLAGGIVSAGGQMVVAFAPWIAVTIGAVLIVAGAWLLTGRHFSVSVFGRLAARINSIKRGRAVGFLVFGIAYGAAALGCTLPIFLLVVANSFALRGVAAGLVGFLAYATGMAVVMVAVTVGVVFFREALYRWLQRVVPFVSRFSGLLLVGSGVYIIYYWLSSGIITGGA